MGRLAWYLNRLRAMNAKEVMWRIQQKMLERQERRYAQKPVAVTEMPVDATLSHLTMEGNRLGICTENDGHIFKTTIPLLGGYDYETFKRDWHAGFQTHNHWEKTCSYDLRYKQRDDIGDARTNWELNRHFQFALLAKNYFFSKDDQYVDELKKLFDDWNRKNPFLIGISWTSVMEVAIRAISWMYCLAFLQLAGKKDDEKLMDALRIGILQMISYVEKHHSRYSSANNHLLVEAAAITLGGVAFDHEPWVKEGVDILTEELPKQYFADGVNKEMSLHYQVFAMEAYALAAHVLIHQRRTLPSSWLSYLDRQCDFVCHCAASNDRYMEFGDDDEGKILDLDGGFACHTEHVLQWCSLLLGKRWFLTQQPSETLRCLFPIKTFEALSVQQRPHQETARCYQEGGYTMLRSEDRRVLIGMDHAPLGFGSICAHGHADALSVQLMIDGVAILADPGTYLYHCDLARRNAFRQTSHHNTMCVEGKDQSEMLGAFLWGKKAHCRLLDFNHDGHITTLRASHDGYAPIIHERELIWDQHALQLTLHDRLSQSCQWTLSFVVGPACLVSETPEGYLICHDDVECLLRIPQNTSHTLADIEVSERYGIKTLSKQVLIRGNAPQFSTILDITYHPQT